MSRAAKGLPIVVGSWTTAGCIDVASLLDAESGGLVSLLLARRQPKPYVFAETGGTMTAQQVLCEQQQALERIAAVKERVAAHSSWSEQTCRLHEDSFAAIVEAHSPVVLAEGLGGDEVSPMTCAAVCEAVADADTAAAWHVMVFNAAKLMAAKWPAELVEML